MTSYFKLTIFVIMTSLVPFFGAAAIDFDHDGVADFVVIDISSSKKLEWFAVDINDTTRRSLGEFGSLGNHLAVGNWSGDNTTSKALISKLSSGAFEWSIALSSGTKKLNFGSFPSRVVAGFDVDNNGAIDPAVVAVGPSALEWKILNNPSLVGNPSETQQNFGGKKALPFFANLDGSGDQIGFASVNSKGTLSIRSKNVRTSVVKISNILNFKSSVLAVLPAKSKTGKDLLFVVSGSGNRLILNIINEKKRVRRVTVASDGIGSVVVGNYFGIDHEELAVRKNDNVVTFVDTNGRKTSMNLNLGGVVVADDININSFSDSEQPVVTPNPPVPGAPTPVVPTTGKANPVCAGIMNSTAHLLYKPASDTTGNAVVVFDGVYKKEFLHVSVQLKDGTYTEAFWTGLALWGNPDSVGMRQHWRTNKRASDIANNALIKANDGTQDCTYQLPGASNRRWE